MTFYRHSQRERFENPLPGDARIAVLSPHFLEKDGVRCFVGDEVTAIANFAPEILAGTVQALLHLAPDIHPTKAVVVFSGSRIGTISAMDRNLLWIAFQVPLFEQCFGFDGSIVARECEAHDGLHVFAASGNRMAHRTEACPCGRPEPRL